MAEFSNASLDRLQTCRWEIDQLFWEVVKGFDCIILDGHRGKEKQNEAYRNGRSTLKYPQSKHNHSPSLAVDVAPYFAEAPHIRWENRIAFYHFAGYVLGVADRMDVPIRWGGDWDSDRELKDQSFFDLVHFELTGEDYD